MSDTDAKDMEELHEQSPRGSEEGGPEQKRDLMDEPSQEAEDDTIDEITETLQRHTFNETPSGDRGRSQTLEKGGQKTIEQWLTRDNLVVYPVWIGNLPRDTSVPDLRRFLENEIGRVLISVHISPKRNSNERTYAFLNLPTAEKQILAVTLLDGTTFRGEKLIVRSKRPSKFPQSFFGSSPISDHFKHFRDCVVPAILAAPTVNLNVHAVKRIMEEHNVGLDHLPNRVWCVQCTLTPNCHRTYCSFYHNQEERELGRIISILAAQNCNDTGESSTGFDLSPNENGELKRPVAVSRHTLLIEGLPKSVSTQKLTEMFEVFGEIDHVIVNPNNTCFLRMKRSQDARKIVHLLNMNNSGIQIQFAPYAANPHLMSALRSASVAKRNKLTESYGKNTDRHSRSYHRSSARSGGPLNLGDRAHDWSHDSMDTDVTTVSMPSLGTQTFAASGPAGSTYSGQQQAGASTSRRGLHLDHQSRSAGPATHAGAQMSYASGMPHAPPPPAALFKEDDMPYMRQTTPHSVPTSSTWDFMEDRSGMMTPSTTDYRQYPMMMGVSSMNNMGYSTPTASDWNAGYRYNYSYHYPYPQTHTGLPQMSPFSASDPVPYQSNRGGFAGGYQTHQQHPHQAHQVHPTHPTHRAQHPGYQREQPSRHRHHGHGRRHMEQQPHSSHAYPAQRSGGDMRTTRRQEHVEGGNAGQVQSATPSKQKKGRASLNTDPSNINNLLDDILG